MNRNIEETGNRFIRPPETEQERQERHRASLEAYRALVDPTAPPRAPYVMEQHFCAPEEGDVSGLVNSLEERGYQIDTFAYDPDSLDRTWSVIALKLDFLEEERILLLSDEMEQLAREHEVVYDGWLTRVE